MSFFIRIQGDIFKYKIGKFDYEKPSKMTMFRYILPQGYP